MSYRDRFSRPTEPQTERFLLAQAYRNVFATPDGQKVLDHICQVLCGMDAIVSYTDPTHAVAIIERQNVGKQIATLALAPDDKVQQLPKVTHASSGNR